MVLVTEVLAPSLMFTGVGTQIVARFGKWFTDLWFETIMKRPCVVLNKSTLLADEWMLLVEFLHSKKPPTGKKLSTIPYTVCDPANPRESQRVVLTVPTNQFTIHCQGIEMYVDPQLDSYGAIVAFEIWHMGKKGSRHSRMVALKKALKPNYLIKGNERRFAKYFEAQEEQKAQPPPQEQPAQQPPQKAKPAQQQPQKAKQPQRSEQEFKEEIKVPAPSSPPALRRRHSVSHSHMAEMSLLMGAAAADTIQSQRTGRSAVTVEDSSEDSDQLPINQQPDIAIYSDHHSHINQIIDI